MRTLDRGSYDEGTRVCVMTGVREHGEGYPVELWRVDGRLVVKALNEGGNNNVEIDLFDLIAWLRNGAPAEGV